MTKPTEPGWRENAVCAQTDYAIFFPELGESAAAAKKVCAVCPVRAECLAEALARREPHGVWGGTTPRERRRLLLAARSDRRVA